MKSTLASNAKAVSVPLLIPQAFVMACRQLIALRFPMGLALGGHIGMRAVGTRVLMALGAAYNRHVASQA